MKKRIMSFLLTCILVLSAVAEPSMVMGMESESESLEDQGVESTEVSSETTNIESMESTSKELGTERTDDLAEDEKTEIENDFEVDLDAKDEGDPATDQGVESIAESLEDEEEKQPSAGELTEERSENGYYARLTLNDVDTLGTAKWLTFIIWSDKDGQDDAKGYTSAGNGRTHSVDVYFADHKDAGLYHVHVYITGTDGVMRFLTASTFEVEELPESEMKVVSADESKGTFEVNAYAHVPRKNIQDIYVKAWASQDQSDLHTYVGERQSDGTYSVKIDVKDYGYRMGEYHLECYVEDTTGNLTKISSISHSVKFKTGELNADLSEEGYSARVTLDGVKTQGAARWLTFIVWSDKGGQDDAVGYTSAGNGEMYFVDVYFANHKDAGLYHVHAYLTGKDGKMHFLKASTFEVRNLPHSEIEVVAEDKNRGLFDINAYINFPQNRIGNIYVEAWTKDDRSDLYRYIGQRQTDGTYVVQADVKNHEYHLGKYHLVCYVEDIYGIETEMAASEYTVNLEAGELFAERTEDGCAVRLTLNDVKTQGTDKWLTFIVWSDKNGQDDVKGYTAINSEGTCVREIYLYNHKDPGTYNVHVYVTGQDGKMHFLKASTFEVEQMPEEGIEIINVNEENGTFDTSVYLARNPETVSAVYAYVWTQPDQSDFTRYIVQKQPDGNYKASINARKHKWYSGTYQVHVYIQDAQGQLTFIDSSTAKLMLGSKVDIKTVDEYSVRLKIWGVRKDVVSVKVPTWGVGESSGDIYWYEGEKATDGSWNADIHTINHEKAGTFVSHIYAYTNDGATYLNQASFEIAEKWEGRWIDPDKPMVALTFDDGPSTHTTRILNSLEEHDQAATFFVVGYNAARYGSVMKRMLELGCEIGNHSYNHPNLTRLSYSGIVNEMAMTNEKIYAATGTYATVSRTPGGSINSTVKQAISTPIIMWSIDTLDWKTRNTWSTVNSVLNNVEDGDIVLMHDIHSPTIAAAEILIPELVERGYQLVTVSELAKYRGNGMKAGQVYYSFN